jgi:hypothetical protein
LSWFIVALYLAAIVAANLSTARFGPSASIVNALLLIGLDLTARDRLHDSWRGRGLWLRMAVLIATGSAISWVLNRDAGQIALASCVAFGLAGAADALAYHLLGSKARLLRINGSNVVSAVVDSAVFPALAFGFPLLWPVMLGQFAAKTVGGACWSLILGTPGCRIGLHNWGSLSMSRLRCFDCPAERDYNAYAGHIGHEGRFVGMSMLLLALMGATAFVSFDLVMVTAVLFVLWGMLGPAVL